MSEAMKCDRCGKFVDSRDIPAIRGWRTETGRRNGSPMLKMDLCDECYDALEDFLVKEMKDDTNISNEEIDALLSGKKLYSTVNCDNNRNGG